MNCQQTPYPQDCLHTLFEQQVDRDPEAIAIRFDGQELTYQQLDQQANRLAHALLQAGATTDVPIAIHLERSPELIVAVLAILKAGAPYLPIDRAYPTARKQLFLEISGAPLLITKTDDTQDLAGFQGTRLLLDQLAPLEGFVERPTVSAKPDDLAYVIYTSGSTGVPKGVAMHHSPLVNLIHWQNTQSEPALTTLQYTSISFDPSFMEIFATFLTGGVLVLIRDDQRRDSAFLLRYLEEEKIERLFLPFIALSELAEAAQRQGLYPSSLREVITAGEQLLITPAVANFFQNLPSALLSNQYGPTETHVATAVIYTGAPQDWEPVPSIGGPIANTQLYVVNEQFELLPLGEEGELYIGGDCLARGYLNRPELTAERFVPNPFGEGRLYKTGDLVKWRADGALDFLGRLDHQVKIRGHRVELGEIEVALQRHPKIQQSVVVARGTSSADKRLIAYSIAPEPPSAGELRSFLADSFPSYMIPAAFVFVESFPLTGSGKVDRKALPDLELSPAAPTPSQHEGALGQVLSLWQELIGTAEALSPDDAFLDVGGHSLLLPKLRDGLEKRFGVELSVVELFEYPTAKALAQRVSQPPPSSQKSGILERAQRQREAASRFRRH